jgi:hypothetical protein
MSKRTDLQSILILGSGPIVIGPAAEFDYGGTQAVRETVPAGRHSLAVLIWVRLAADDQRPHGGC